MNIEQYTRVSSNVASSMLTTRLRLFCFATSYSLLFLILWHFHMSSIWETAFDVATPQRSRVVNTLRRSGKALFSTKDVKPARNDSYVFRQGLVYSSASNKSTTPLCPMIPPNLVGHLPIKRRVPSLDVMHEAFPHVTDGGRFTPKECTPKHRVAILVPYRDRAKHLQLFIFNIHRFMSRQQIEYGVYIIEQADTSAFNRAKLFNVGFVESTALYDYECFVFHDVDLLPIDDHNLYTCPEQPRHMCVTIDGVSGVFYPTIFGGVSALTKEQFLRVNGYSNMYWGWGAEDDDMSERLRKQSWTIYRRPAEVARYVSLFHVHTNRSNNRSLDLLSHWRGRYKTDGLNSLVYERLHISFEKMYTWIKVDLKQGK
ncbi:beta-1,4-N-acetylgalactosaminyltransferase bre-4-like isoform X1 [Dermacentor andersoni]|uniref:beta-1,4-N-acetylgalactosaminyltransferase bre-4-like isoform X1 n=1 Tax=Dermacentor andersoni TaxID=34620 RepID=UPI002155EDD8|nr:beta-1,4-N-acetylgalactosaminyltransferase bre-4-like isoform X1 [Dermacentor andersoni]XP_054918099.1 beta-1,4-N-acetylgalactosaminyltransferase bre-4-like isoform X1 [Dermacentor andersoni]